MGEKIEQKKFVIGDLEKLFSKSLKRKANSQKRHSE